MTRSWRHPELTHLDIFAAAREDSRWNRTKGLVKDKTGAVSFEVLKQLLVSLAKEQLGL